MNTNGNSTSSLTSDSRVLVTGGSGFMGTHLINILEEDNIAIANIDFKAPKLEKHNQYWFDLDILNKEGVFKVFKEFQPTHVVHLAARTDLDETKDINGYAANIQGVDNIVNASMTSKVIERIVVTSTMLVCKIGYTPTSDTDYATSTVYGDSKVQTEVITRKINPECIWSIVRPSTIWGPYHEGMRNAFFRVLRKGLYVHPGNKPCMRSYGYVGNSIFQIIKILEARPELVHKKTFYISDPVINLRDWVSAFSHSLMGREIRVIPLPIMKLLALFGDVMVKLGMIRFPMTTFRLTNMTTDGVVDIEPVTSVTGPLPFSMDDGVKLTTDWLKKNP